MQAASERATVQQAGAVQRLARLLSYIRFDEVLVLQGSPLLGAILSIGGGSLDKAASLAIFAAGSFCLVAHVFVLNDWSDLRSVNGTIGARPTQGLGRREIACLWIALLALSLVLLSPFGARTLVIALGIVGLSALYSAPGLHMKGVPLVNSALHFTGGLLHFLLGHSLFRPVDGRGTEIGCFFALVFVAGHLTHEARDRETDLRNGIRTNAVAFGGALNFAAGFALFTIADVLLVVLAARGTLPRALVLAAASYPFHVYWTLRTWRAGLTFASIRRLQVRYRVRYAVVALMMVAAVLFSR